MSDEKAITLTEKSIMPVEEFHSRMAQITQFLKKEMREGPNGEGDYGILPGTKKKSLYKRGAEKLAILFHYAGVPEKVSEVLDWEKGFVYFKYRCVLTHLPTGKVVATVTRSCNNKERGFASSGKSVYDLANPVEARAQKRAFVAAVVIATNASQLFDVENETNDDDERNLVPPNRSVTKEEDPVRNRLTMRLYGTAKDHGWSDAWIHAAIKKKWGKESLTEIASNQIDQLAEFITTTYQIVKPGEKPVLRNAAPVPPVSIPASNNIVEGEVKKEAEAVERKEVSIPSPVVCRNTKKHGDKPPVVNHPEGAAYTNAYFCDEACQVDYWGEKPKSKLDILLERGRAKKKEAEATGESVPEVLPDAQHPALPQITGAMFNSG